MEILLILILAAAVLAPATKTGRRAIGNFAKSAHKATGWRTPRDAVHHYSGRAGAVTGRLTASGARAGRRAAGKAGRSAATAAGRRWQDRIGSGGLRPMLWRPAPDTSQGGEPAPAASTPADGQDTAGPAPAGTAPAGGPVPGAGQPPAGTAGGQSTAQVTPAPSGAEQKRKPMSTRYTMNLEPPSTDGEFLESCVTLGDILKSLAEQIGNWADGLGALNLPQSVLNPLHQVSEGITEAATGAAQAAKAFEDEFEDARDVASRGMTITGQDAA